MDVLLKVVTVGGAAYAVLLAIVFVLQGNLLYFPDAGRQILQTPKDVGLDYEQVWLTTEDGVRIEAWYVPAPAARGAVLLAHGNAGNISHRLDYALMFHRLGYSLLLLRIPRLRPQRRQAERGGHLRRCPRRLAPPRGAAGIPARAHRAGGRVPGRRHRRPACCGRAPRGAGACLVLRLGARAGGGALSLAAGAVAARYRYDALEALARVSSPVLIAHSRQDDIVPFRHGERLFAAAKGPKAFLELAGGHNDGFLFTREAWREALGRFLAQHLPADAMSPVPR
ncbi:alpha/beta hydrolase [Polaromonas sp. P1(28)-8]|nr:alpha/beta hydrolase [Polaromonas sp. P1(28)-8]